MSTPLSGVCAQTLVLVTPSTTRTPDNLKEGPDLAVTETWGHQRQWPQVRIQKMSNGAAMGRRPRFWKKAHLTSDPGYGSGLGSKRAFTLETQNHTAIGCLWHTIQVCLCVHWQGPWAKVYRAHVAPLHLQRCSVTLLWLWGRVYGSGCGVSRDNVTLEPTLRRVLNLHQGTAKDPG